MLNKRRGLFEIVTDALILLNENEELGITDIMKNCYVNNIQCKKILHILFTNGWIEQCLLYTSDARRKSRYKITGKGKRQLKGFQRTLEEFRESLIKTPIL